MFNSKMLYCQSPCLKLQCVSLVAKQPILPSVTFTLWARLQDHTDFVKSLLVG